METIYEDSSIAAINKPAGISVANDRVGKASLVDLLQIQRKDEKKLKIIHQLDKETSGIIVLAKDADSQRKMSQHFESGQVRMIYLALTTSGGVEKSGIIDVPLSEDPKNQQKMRVDLKHGKPTLPAQTKWQILAEFSGISLLAIQPITDRTHQIRVHLQHSGIGLVIDPLYGRDEAIMLSNFKPGYRLSKYAEEKPLIERLTLCAYQLEIENYFEDGKKLGLIASLEKKFKATVKMLTKYNAGGQKAFVNEENFTRLINAEPLILDI